MTSFDLTKQIVKVLDDKKADDIHDDLDVLLCGRIFYIY